MIDFWIERARNERQASVQRTNGADVIPAELLTPEAVAAITERARARLAARRAERKH
jgi:hypothetical protein